MKNSLCLASVRFALGCLAMSIPLCRAEVRQVDSAWVLENAAIRTVVESRSGRLTVLDKRSGVTWAQEDPAARAEAEERVRVRQRAAPVSIDGRDEDWPRENMIWLPWTGPDGERNCSGGARVMWDADRLYLHVRVRDDNVAFGGESAEQWWEADSVEFWVDSVQVGLHLAPGGAEVAATPRGEPIPGTEIAVLPITEGRLPGYAAELSMPLEHFPILRNPQPGIRFRFAIGLNDADPKPGEETRRVAQGYFPSSWVHSVPQSFAVAVLTDARGEAPAPTDETDRAGGVLGGRVSGMKPDAVPDSIAYRLQLPRGQHEAVDIDVRIALSGDPAALTVTLTPVDGPETALRAFAYPPPLYPDRAPESFFLAVADYCNGRYVPVTDTLYRRKRLSLQDLPFVTVTDGTQGVMLLALTPFDAAADTQVRHGDEAQAGFPALTWLPSKGRFGPPRSGQIVFYDRGGYVSACKLYRRVAAADGYVKTLREKAEAHPDVLKLLGAVNWWGAPGLSFVREAQGAGMRRGLLNGRPSPDDMAEIVERGWLVGEYDNYVDIDDSPTIARAKAPVAEHAVVKEDGEFMTAWISRDKDMNPTHTYMKHCTAKQLECARKIIPDVLATYPYNTRFLDVTTAETLKECYSPVHPTTRASDAQNRRALCRYVAEELGLVTGGEHGRFWDVDILHYHEGMMGGGMYSWPAGYLRDVESRDQLSERYLEYSINPANRVPLFELVFHDCVVNYWYWGACSDYLHQVAPEITDRKTAMNVLYGTPPMMWADAHGLHWSRPEEREMMLTIYRNVCRLHEIIGAEEMLSHGFRTPDRLVQQTEFDGGTVCTANFGAEPYTFTPVASGEPVTLHENDFHVRGPHIAQWRLSTPDGNGRPAITTFIRTDDFLFVDSSRDLVERGIVCRGKVCLELEAPETARLTMYAEARADIETGRWRPSWAGNPLALLRLDEQGNPVARGPDIADGRIVLTADRKTVYRILAGDSAARPDVTVEQPRLSVAGQPVDPDSVLPADAVLDIRVPIANLGLAPATDVIVELRVDGGNGPLLQTEPVGTLQPGQRVDVTHRFPARHADGYRRIAVVVQNSETSCQTGRGSASAAFTGPLTPDSFPLRHQLTVQVPAGDCAGLPVTVDFDLKTMGQPLPDPDSLRVLFPGRAALPAQFEANAPESTGGVLVFRLPEGLSGSADIQAMVLGLPAGTAVPYPHTTRFAVQDDGADLRFDTYSCTIAGGTLTNLCAVGADSSVLPLVSQIIESSKENGWSHERGDIQDLTCTHSGPVRTVFHLRRRLEPDVQLERRFIFYADRFEIQSKCTPPRSLLTRVFFLRDGNAVNETGNSAVMDGKGQGEDFGFKGSPQWYAVSGDGYRFACIALTPATGFTYWDSGSRGQIGLGHAGDEWERRVFIVAPESAGADFPKGIAEAYRNGSGKSLP